MFHDPVKLPFFNFVGSLYDQIIYGYLLSHMKSLELRPFNGYGFVTILYIVFIWNYWDQILELRESVLRTCVLLHIP